MVSKNTEVAEELMLMYRRGFLHALQLYNPDTHPQKIWDSHEGECFKAWKEYMGRGMK